MSILEIDPNRVRTGAVQLGAAATATHDGASALAQLRLSAEQAGAPDGEVVAQAVARFAERASDRLAQIGSAVRTHSVDLRDACISYTRADRALAARLHSVR